MWKYLVFETEAWLFGEIASHLKSLGAALEDEGIKADLSERFDFVIVRIPSDADGLKAREIAENMGLYHRCDLLTGEADGLTWHVLFSLPFEPFATSVPVDRGLLMSALSGSVYPGVTPYLPEMIAAFSTEDRDIFRMIDTDEGGGINIGEILDDRHAPVDLRAAAELWASSILEP